MRLDLARRCGAFTVLVALALSPLGGGRLSSAAERTPNVGGPPLTINIAAFTGATIPTFALQAADVLGEYQKAGLQAKITETVSANMVPLIVSGRADIACLAGPFFAALLAGQQLTTVVGIGAAQPYVLVVKSTINSVRELKGKTIGVPGLQGFQGYEMVKRLFDDNGIKEADVNYVALPTEPDREAALTSGRLDATILTADGSFAIAGQPGIKVLVQNAGANYPIPYGTCFATKAYANAHQEELRRFALALVMTQRALTSKATFAQAVSKAIPAHYSSDLTDKAFKYYTDDGYWCVNGCLNPGWFQDALAIHTKETPQATTVVKMSDFFNPSYVQWALDQLGGAIATKSDKGAWYKKSG